MTAFQKELITDEAGVLIPTITLIRPVRDEDYLNSLCSGKYGPDHPETQAYAKPGSPTVYSGAPIGMSRRVQEA